MFGFGTATVNENLQFTNIEIFYNPKEFIDVLRGNKKVDEVNQSWKAGACPFHAMVGGSSSLPTNKTPEEEGLLSKNL
jgi:hypothetical protein